MAGDSIVVSVRNQALSTNVRRRAFLDGTTPSVNLTDPTLYAVRFVHSADNNSYVLKYSASTQLELINRLGKTSRRHVSVAQRGARLVCSCRTLVYKCWVD
ncbi:MAG TPA: hypothetical protein VJV79_10980 [Polyangiaceae bacterium]|nr:hypothetical protein [Polyangiaceae bacterium]